MTGFEFGNQKARRIRQEAIQKCLCLGNDWGYLGIRVNEENNNFGPYKTHDRVSYRASYGRNGSPADTEFPRSNKGAL